jgi:nucleotide-binding universal stress UspA family protein
MVSRVLVPMDDSEMSEHALEYALGVYPDAKITVLTVVGEPSSMWAQATGLALADNLEEAAEESAQSIFYRAREIVADANGDAELETVYDLGHPVRAIINHASDYETVVIGTHGGSLADNLYVGDVAKKVVNQSPVPVVVVR